MRLLAELFAFAACLATVAPAPVLAQAKQARPAPLKVEPTAPQAARLAPPPVTDKANLLLLDLSTGGRVTIWLRPDVAPKMVERVKTLTRQHFYDGLTFHRVIDGFMAQGGDPKGDGTGGSQLANVPAEFNYLPHVRGAVSAARAEDKDSANSQFFIVFQPRLSLDKKYTVFGRVIDGMEYVDAVQRGEPPIDPSRIVHAYIAADNPPAYVPAPAPPPAGLGAPVTLPGTAAPAGVAAPKPAANDPAPPPASRTAPRPAPRQAAPRR
ncbi:peptidylprolyl isomerase [Sphingomonas rubra]|uniref:Peptidyl-prolyl cis-trans isomerase n=1 Tax=Sphingomonas rubra TaxID=634430 RepID=A0A1I5QIE1_9SPHN|nr:peptidylprolyl isomerase [Sphingomonas rubra]SFP45810.1 peptidylprolyl isomerase [Sphingomonas rubra]